MQQFTALFLREFRSYFRNLSVYFVLFVYLFASIGTAFYFGSYLGMHDMSLYALFYAQPIIAAVLIPVLTMRSWAEEYRSGTIESLLTQPVSFSILAAAKFCAVSTFGVLAMLGLLPFIIYSAGWLNLDWQNIITNELGLLFVMLFFSATGIFISALTSNLILAYLLSFFGLAVWVALPCFGLYAVYNNFLFAEIGVSDVLYFVSFTAVFVFFNIIVLSLQSSSQKNKWQKAGVFMLILLAGAAFFNIALSNFFAGKADFTAAELYTPKKQTVELLDNLQEPVMVDVFAAKDYINANSDYFHYLQQIQRFLRRYQRLSGGIVSVNITYVEPFSELEEKVLEKGLYFETNAGGSRNYLGAVVRTSDGKEAVIKQFLLQRQPWLEKDIDMALLKVTEPERIKNVGVFVDNMQNLEGLQEILLNWENDYNVFNISPSMYEFSDKADLLVLINPKKIPTALRYGIDQFIMRGGRVVVFFDFFTASQSDLTNSEDVQFVDFLNNWRVSLKTIAADEGRLEKVFGYSPLGLRLNKAFLFEVDNPAVKVVPFITNENGLVGAVLEGSFSSLYSKNPYAETELASTMKPFLKQSLKAGKVALVGDVDFLEAAFWVAENSPDGNPYSVIEKSGNGAAARALIDYMADNRLYEQLPVGNQLFNVDSIGQRLMKNIYSRQEAAYKVLQNKIQEQKRVLFEQSNENAILYEELTKVGTAGKELAQNEEKLQRIEYKMKNDYSIATAKMMIMQILIIPLLEVVVLFLLAKFCRLRHNRRLKEKYNA